MDYEAKEKYLKLIGHTIKMFRVGKGVKQKDVAEHLKIYNSQVSDIENGKTNISIFMLKNILGYLGVSRWEFEESVERRDSL